MTRYVMRALPRGAPRIKKGILATNSLSMTRYMLL